MSLAPSPHRQRARATASLLTGWLLLATGCSSPGNPPERPEFAARRALAVQAEAGPVLAEVVGQPALIDANEVAALTTREIARAVPAMNVTFTTDPANAVAIEPHLVVVYDPAPAVPGEAACSAPGGLSLGPAPDRTTVLAAFCDGTEVIGVVREQAEVQRQRDVERLLWRVAQRLFPDDIGETYGINVLPDLGAGLGGSFGF